LRRSQAWPQPTAATLGTGDALSLSHTYFKGLVFLSMTFILPT
jgi:hypothetical protein